MLRSAVLYQFADIVVDPGSFTVEKSGQVLSLEPKSIRLLLYLLQNRSRAVTKEELLRSVWEDVTVSDNSLARLIAQLRKGLGDDAKVARYIETVPTVGYRFIAEVAEMPSRVPPAPALSLPTPPEALPALAPPLARRRFRWFAVAVFALAVLAGLVGYSRWQSNRRGPMALRSGTMLGGPMIASHPRLSPDGQLLAFRAIIDGLSQVAVMKPDSSSWTVLTHDRTNGAVASVSWSRDGSRIYFDRVWGPGRIYTIGPLGGEPRLVMENAWLPEPLPDGSIVAQRHSSDGQEHLLRYWPDTGRLQPLPASTRHTDSPAVRAFPNGSEIAVFGLPAEVTGAPRLFVLNLETLRINIPPSTVALAGAIRDPIAISPDGGSILAQRRRDDTFETVVIPKSGSRKPQTLISLPSISAPISTDAAPDGSIYMDHSVFEQSVLILDPLGAVRAEISISQPARGPAEKAVIPVSGGGIIFEAQRHGRSDLFLGKAGSEPQLVLNGPESAGLPGALLGDERLAFVLGGPGQPRIAIASLRDGAIIRRFATDAPQVTAMTAPADGKTLYYVSGGTIWAQPVSGGDPRKITQGSKVAIDPSGRLLYPIRAGADGYEAFRMPADGGDAERIPMPAGFNLNPLALSSSAVDRSGRILLPVNILDVFFYRTAVVDPVRHTTVPVPVPPRVVVMSAGWTGDGNIAACVVRWSSSLWRYRPQDSAAQ